MGEISQSWQDGQELSHQLEQKQSKMQMSDNAPSNKQSKMQMRDNAPRN